MDTAFSALLGFAASFCVVGLKGFQFQNMSGGHFRAVFITSMLITFSEVLAVNLIVRNGLLMALPNGIGAAFGVVVSMKLHDRFFKKKET